MGATIGSRPERRVITTPTTKPTQPIAISAVECAASVASYSDITGQPRLANPRATYSAVAGRINEAAMIGHAADGTSRRCAIWRAISSGCS